MSQFWLRGFFVGVVEKRTRFTENPGKTLFLREETSGRKFQGNGIKTKGGKKL